ncbi:unnamed protein product [Schistocephalus solidus]|uniref:V-SNARE coiled-coil homology domain-containing protein n=1 Tax=Schistocephalus solidus TaxID=70667 RepID=A0A183SAZ2_SCHSO|nr:unnamed protein product [Schistocephalus solidus]
MYVSNHPENSAAPPADGRPAPSQATNKRFQQTQAQVNEVVDIMRVNMEKVLERDAALGKLDDRADALQAGASQFEASAGKLKNKYWWKNMKVRVCLALTRLDNQTFNDGELISRQCGLIFPHFSVLIKGSERYSCKFVKSLAPQEYSFGVRCIQNY